jgi:hypothetical protein
MKSIKVLGLFVLVIFCCVWPGMCCSGHKIVFPVFKSVGAGIFGFVNAISKGCTGKTRSISIDWDINGFSRSLDKVYVSGLPNNSRAFGDPESFFWLQNSKGMRLVATYTNKDDQIFLKPVIPLISGETYLAVLDLNSEGNPTRLESSNRIPDPPPQPPPPPSPPVETRKQVGALVFRLCPPSRETFHTANLGSSEEEPGRESEGEEVRKAELKHFWLGETEVTRLQFLSIMEPGRQVSTEEGNLPVSNISWEEADEFCRRFSSSCNVKARLPSEDEWEFASRAGSTLPFSVWKRGLERLSSDLADAKGNEGFGRDAEGSFVFNRSDPSPVGRMEPNAWGLYDMHGNVWEWCGDGSSLKVEFPKRPCRGGAFTSIDWWSCRSCSRGSEFPDKKVLSIGFRVLLEME